MKQCLKMSRNWGTPVSYWMSIPLRELRRWIDVSNEFIRETKE